MSLKKNESIKVAFAGGGTGGHVYPIVAVHEELKSLSAEMQFVYFGSKDKLEENVSAENKIPFCPLPFIGGMPRSASAVLWFFKFAMASFKAVLKLSEEKPQVLFATGGYSAAPVLFAAKLLKIPYVIHNLDAHLGLANAAFIESASALTLGLPLHNRSQHPKDGPVLVTGNPVRRAFLNEDYDKKEIYSKLALDPNRKTLVAIGGSQGAQALNEAILEVADTLLANNWQIIHQLGPKQYARFEESWPKNPFYKPEKYLNNLPEIYAITDLAVSRAGAMSIAELVAKRVVTIFIPLPSAAQNHQFHNAKHLEQEGCALVLEQKELNENTLLEAIKFATERTQLFKLGLQSISSVQSAEKLAEIVLAVAKKTNI